MSNDMMCDDGTDLILWRVQKFAVVRKAVTYILHGVVGYSEGRCPMEYLVAPLNAIAGAGVGGDKRPFSKELIQIAFQSNNPNSLVKCSAVAVGSNLDGILHTRAGRQDGSRHNNDATVYDFGLFEDVKSAKRGKSNVTNATIISESLFRSIDIAIVPNELRIAVENFSKQHKKAHQKTGRELLRTKRIKSPTVQSRRRRKGEGLWNQKRRRYQTTI